MSLGLLVSLLASRGVGAPLWVTVGVGPLLGATQGPQGWGYLRSLPRKLVLQCPDGWWPWGEGWPFRFAQHHVKLDMIILLCKDLIKFFCGQFICQTIAEATNVTGCHMLDLSLHGFGVCLCYKRHFSSNAETGWQLQHLCKAFCLNNIHYVILSILKNEAKVVREGLAKNVIPKWHKVI